MHNNWHDAQQSQPNQPIEKYFVFHGANLAQRTHLVLEEMTNAVCLAKRSVGHSVVWINHVQMAAMAEFCLVHSIIRSFRTPQIRQKQRALRLRSATFVFWRIWAMRGG
jgi:hypothetical protein